MEPSDQAELTALVRQAQLGREAAQRDLIRAYQNRIAGFIYTIIGSSEAVEDIAQVVFIKMIRSLPNLTQPAQFEAWLFRLAKNTCIDHIRRQRWHRLFSPLDQDQHSEIPESPQEVDSEELDMLRHALSQLKPTDRALISLAQQGFSQTEMAQANGITVVALKARLHRAREQLRHHYEHAT